MFICSFKLFKIVWLLTFSSDFLEIVIQYKKETQHDCVQRNEINFKTKYLVVEIENSNLGFCPDKE